MSKSVSRLPLSIDLGEVHSGVLLARTALGAVEAVASEYGLEIRSLCCQALRRGAPSSEREAAARGLGHVRKVRGYVRDPRLAALFLRRPTVSAILEEARACGVEIDMEQLWPSAPTSRRAAALPPGSGE